MRRSELKVEDISKNFASAADATVHAINVMNAALAKARYVIPKGPTRLYLEMKRDLPYFVHDTTIPGVQILLNRYYKPLGLPGNELRDWVVYEDCETMHLRLSFEQIASIVAPGHERGLYGDSSSPWSSRKSAIAYVNRLENLLSFIQRSTNGG